MIKKRILLLNPPGDKLYSRDKYCSSISKASYYWAPIDLLILSGILNDNYSLKVIDAIIEKKSHREAYNDIIAYKPEIIISLTSSATWRSDFQFLKEIKNAIDCRAILSGGIVLTQSKYILENNTFIDACLLDFTTKEVLNYIENNGPIFNMVYRDGDRIIESDRKIENDFSIPLPRHELFPINKYNYPISIYHPSTCLITSLGCTYKCSFCVPATIQYRARNIKNTISELKYISSLGIKEVVFQDSTFSLDKNYTELLCNQMIADEINVSWICLTRVDSVDESLLLLMKKAGCHTIEFGVEAGDDETLQRVSKGITREKIKQAFSLCKKTGIRTCAFFILGLPGQDTDLVENTIKFSLEINADMASFSFPMPYHGTKLGEDIISDNKQLYEFNDIQVTKSINTNIKAEKLRSLRNKAYRVFYFRINYVLRQLVSIKSFYQLRLMFKEAISLVLKYVLLFGQ